MQSSKIVDFRDKSNIFMPDKFFRKASGMKKLVLSFFLVQFGLVAHVNALEPDSGLVEQLRDDIYFYSCQNIGKAGYLGHDIVASPFDAEANLLHYSDIEAMLTATQSDSASDHAKLSEEIEAELSRVQDGEYRSQLRLLLSNLKKSANNYFSVQSIGDGVTVKKSSKFINSWFSDYGIESTECVARRYDVNSQSRWSISDDFAILKISAGKAVAPDYKGTLGDIIEVSGLVSNVTNCSVDDQIYRMNDCVKVTLETEAAVTNLTLSVLDLNYISTLKLGGMAESKECIMTKHVSLDKYGVDDALENLSAETIIKGGLVVGGAFVGVDPGISGTILFSETAVGEVAEGSEQHTERLQIDCSTTSLNPLDSTDMNASEDVVDSRNELGENSQPAKVPQLSQAVGEMLLLAEKGTVGRHEALLVIEKLIVGLDVSARTQLLTEFVASEKLSGGELVELLD